MLHFTATHLSTPKDSLTPEKEQELHCFYVKFKKRFYDRKSLLCPLYSLRIDEDGHPIYDKRGVPVLIVSNYCQGQTENKQLLYEKALEDALKELHHVKGVNGKETCLPGGVNALSRLLNEKFCFKEIFNQIRAFLAKCSSFQLRNPVRVELSSNFTLPN